MQIINDVRHVHVEQKKGMDETVTRNVWRTHGHDV